MPQPGDSALPPTLEATGSCGLAAPPPSTLRSVRRLRALTLHPLEITVSSAPSWFCAAAVTHDCHPRLPSLPC